MRNGKLYPPRTLGLPTTASESSSSLGLLPTPRASDGVKGGPNQKGSSGDMMLPSVVAHLALFRTPTAQLAINGGSQHPSKRKAGGHGPTLADEVENEVALLPSPAARDYKSGESNLLERKARPLNEVAVAYFQPVGGLVDWGKFARAVLRWEQVTRQLVPCPLEPGRTGNLVLAPPFVEWMMGLEPGWVTALGLSRIAQLKLLGNGVVPRQAAYALSLLFPRVPVAWRQ
jgi:hypothetical protein